MANDNLQDRLLPLDEQEKYQLNVERRSRTKMAYQSACEPRFYKNGISFFHQLVFVVLFTASLLAAYWQGLRQNSSGHNRSFVPEIQFTSEPVIFTDSPEWKGNSSETDAKWKKWLINFRTHTIAIPKTAIKEFGYRRGHPDTDTSERFAISMFHQLHCVAAIREFAYLPDAKRMVNGKPLEHDKVIFSPHHMDHCFNYLRQTIECLADSTVEWPKFNELGENIGIKPWDIPRSVCRNHQALEDFALANHRI